MIPLLYGLGNSLNSLQAIHPLLLVLTPLVANKSCAGSSSAQVTGADPCSCLCSKEEVLHRQQEEGTVKLSG